MKITQTDAWKKHFGAESLDSAFLAAMPELALLHPVRTRVTASAIKGTDMLRVEVYVKHEGMTNYVVPSSEALLKAIENEKLVDLAEFAAKQNYPLSALDKPNFLGLVQAHMDASRALQKAQSKFHRLPAAQKLDLDRVDKHVKKTRDALDRVMRAAAQYETLALAEKEIAEYVDVDDLNRDHERLRQEYQQARERQESIRERWAKYNADTAEAQKVLSTFQDAEAEALRRVRE